jgi:hypothetical protein
LFDFFTLLSLFYIGVGVRCLVRVVRRWRSLWDDQVTPEDLKLAREASFYILIPPTVALHELGHASVIWLQGEHVAHWMFLGYMGAVWPSGSSGPLGDFLVALAGNLVTLSIGILALGIGLRRPGHPVRNVLWIELGRQSLFLVLVFYPAICLAFEGDFRRIYDFESTPFASATTAIVHAAILSLGYGLLWRRRWRSRAILLSSPVAREFAEAERRARQDPDDLEAERKLGLAYAAVADHVRALPHLRRVVEQGRADARTRAEYGIALERSGDYARAQAELEAALGVLLRPEDRLAAETALVRALVAQDRRTEAMARIEPLVRAHPQNRALRDLFDRVARR